MNISTKIAELLKSKSITQRQLAQEIGINPQTLNNWIINKADSIPSRYIMPMCSALSVTPQELLTCDKCDDTSVIFTSLSWQEMSLVEAYRGIQTEKIKCS